MVEVVGDEAAKTTDRLEAAKWLAERGFGKDLQAVEIDVAPQAIDLTRMSDEDLATLMAILEKHGQGLARADRRWREVTDALNYANPAATAATK